MELFWKAIAAVLVSSILGLHIEKSQKEFHMLLSIAVCCMGATIMLNFLSPVVEFLRELERTAQLNEGILGILLKCTGIALVSEIAGLICQDSGNTSLGKLVQLLGSAVILYLSIPMATALLRLLQDVLGEL